MTLTPFILQSAPRSGSTWFGELINSSPDVIYRYQPIHAWSFPHYLSSNSSSADFNTFYEELTKTQDPYVLQKLGSFGDVRPSFPKNLIPRAVGYKEVHAYEVAIRGLTVVSELCVIFLIRNPLMMLQSWISNPKEFPHGTTLESEWYEAKAKNTEHVANRFGIRHWIESTLAFEAAAKKFPKRTLLVRYENLRVSPVEITAAVHSLLGVKTTNTTSKFAQMSSLGSSRDPYSVYRGMVVSQYPTLPQTIQEQVVSVVEDAGLARYL